MDYTKVSLDSINSGAVSEMFEEELEKVLSNIADDNTDAQKVMAITIKLVIKPSKDRSKADTLLSIHSQLAPLKPNESFILLSSDGKRTEAFTAPRAVQQELVESDNVRHMPIAQGAKSWTVKQ